MLVDMEPENFQKCLTQLEQQKEIFKETLVKYMM